MQRRRGIQVRPGLRIPASEIEVRRTRSGGPGGQNVNKVATRVELRFDVAASSVLTREQKRRIRQRLAGRMSRDGVLRVVAQAHRTQSRNEVAARERLAELLDAALRVQRRRRATRPTEAARQRRLAQKSRRAKTKRERRRPPTDD